MSGKVKFGATPPWESLNMGRINLAVAGDLAADMRNRMTRNEIKPPITAATIKAKSGRSSHAGTTLVDSGMLRDSIKSGKASNTAARIYIHDMPYQGASARIGRSAKQNFVRQTWKAAKGAAGITTLQVAKIHEFGVGVVRRVFFFFTQREYDKAAYLRINQAWKAFARKTQQAK